MPTFNLHINHKKHEIEAAADKPLLWILREELGLTGTKYGCGIGQCGACTVHLDGNPIRSCLVNISKVERSKIITIEGLATDENHPILKAWEVENVPQCGYCQTGQIMAAAALLARHPKPTDQDIDQAMNGNFCRCGTHFRIRKAIHRASSSEL